MPVYSEWLTSILFFATSACSCLVTLTSHSTRSNLWLGTYSMNTHPQTSSVHLHIACLQLLTSHLVLPRKAYAISHRSWRAMWYHGVKMIQGTDARNKRGSDAAWTTKAVRVVRSVPNPPLKPVQICNKTHSNSVTWLTYVVPFYKIYLFSKRYAKYWIDV